MLCCSRFELIILENLKFNVIWYKNIGLEINKILNKFCIVKVRIKENFDLMWKFCIYLVLFMYINILVFDF